VDCIRVLHELGADVNKCNTNENSPVYRAALYDHVECIRMLLALGADVNKCMSDGHSPITVAALFSRVECVRICIQLGANVQPLLLLPAFQLHSSPSIPPIVQDIRSFLDATRLVHSPHQYTLFSVAQLTAYYLERHVSDRPQDTVDTFAQRFAAKIRHRLIVAPFEAAAAKATTTPAKRRLVRLAARTAIDAAVAHADEENDPIDAGLVADVMNLLVSCDAVRDLHSLRLVCKLTYRGCFPVPRCPLLELPTGVVETFLGGSCSRKVSFRCICRALALHSEDAAVVAAVVESPSSSSSSL
jgi:hypothetical protein